MQAAAGDPNAALRAFVGVCFTACRARIVRAATAAASASAPLPCLKAGLDLPMWGMSQDAIAVGMSGCGSEVRGPPGGGAQ